MRHLLSLLIGLMMAFSLATASSAHAVEQAGCVEVTASAAAHYDGDADHVPADADKGQPHHHGTCHGHHVAAPSADAEALTHGNAADLRSPHLTAALKATPTSPALRPPQA